MERKEREDSLAYLQREIGPLSDTTATALCDALEDLPAALGLAIGCIRHHRVSAEAYLKTFLKRQTDLIARGNAPTEYPVLVAASMSADCIEPGNFIPALLGSLLATDDIPFSLVGGWKIDELVPLHMPKQRAQLLELLGSMPEFIYDTSRLKATISSLERLGLVRVASDSFSFVHPLAQAAIYRILPRDKLVIFVDLLLARLGSLEKFEPYDESTWADFARLLPHLESLCSHLEAASCFRVHAGRLLVAAGGYYIMREKLERTQQLCLRALPHLTSQGAEVDEVFASIYEKQGEILQQQGDLKTAKAMWEGALSLLKLSSLTPRAASLFLKLGDLLYKEGKPKDAQKYYQEGLSLAEQDLENMAEVALDCAASLARILQEAGEDEEAARLLRRALEFPLEPSFPPSGPLLLALSVLARALQNLEEYEEARVVLERSASLIEPLGSPAEELLGLVLGDLAATLFHLNEIPEAHSAATRAIRILEAHPETPSYMFALLLLYAGRILTKMGDTLAARQMLTRAQQQNEEVLQDEIEEALRELPQDEMS